MCTGDYWEPNCPGSVATAIGAAFQTQGMYVMADVVYQMGVNNMAIWAPVLYVMAAFSGLIMMALGQPPKMYLWFFMGPAIFNWSLLTTHPVMGTAWNVAGVPQQQEEVWKLSEIGLLNTNVVMRGTASQATGAGNSYNDLYGISGGNAIHYDDEPEGRVHVPLLFVWWDTLISGEMQSLSAWTGIYSQRSNGGEGGTHKKPAAPKGAKAGVTAESNDAWHILTNSKWPMLENATAATIHNNDLRTALVVFLASECGDEFFRNIDEASYVNAAHAKGSALPKHVFKEGDSILDGGSDAWKSFVETVIPAPMSYTRLLKNGPLGDGGSPSTAADKASFPNFIKKQVSSAKKETFKGQFRYVSCAQYLYTLVQGLRWEAGNIYNQLVREARGHNVNEEQVVYNFLYGWHVAEITNGEPTLDPFSNEITLVPPLSIEDQKQFVMNLILIHLIRNEFAYAQNPINTRWSESERSIDYTEAYQRSVGSKSKYGELYTWAKMMPYIQGVLLYLLAVAYPFCCVVMVIPGWWKTIFTWMAFWAWAKSWDVGFAIVQTIERSIWAMVGNHQDQAVINGRIHDMKRFGTLKVDTSVTLGDVESVAPQTMKQAIDTIDFGLLMAGNLDMDLANSYYIYLMSALYFAVPAVTGQVLLGAKAGASSMVNTAVGGMAAETGKNAGAGYTGNTATTGHNAMAATNQANYMKSMRSGAGSQFAAKAYAAKNDGLSAQAASQSLNMAAGQYENAGIAAVGDRQAQLDSAVGVATSKYHAGDAGIKGLFKGPAGSAPPGSAPSSPSAPGSPSSPSAPGSPSSPSAPGTPSTTPGRGRGVLGAMDRGSAHIASVGEAHHKNRQAIARGYANSALRSQAAGMKVAANGHSMMAAGHNMMAGRYDNAAQHAASEEQWFAARDLSQAYAGNMSAKGVFAGAFTAGQRSTNTDGMAGSGQLGSSLQSAFNFADPVSGGYGQQVRSTSGWLDSNVGAGSSLYSFRPTSVTAAASSLATDLTSTRDWASNSGTTAGTVTRGGHDATSRHSRSSQANHSNDISNRFSQNRPWK